MRKLLAIIVFLFALTFVVLSEPQGNFYSTESDDQTLRFWGIYDLPEVYEPIFESFQKEHPEVKVSYKQFSNAEEYHQVLIRQLKKAKGPDVFLFRDSQQNLYQKYLNPSGSELAEGFTTMVQDTLVNNRLLYGLPLWVDSLMLYYNPRYYKEGIRSNWYEFAEQAKDISIGGIAMGRFDNLKTGWDILKTLFLQKQVNLEGKAENNIFDTLEFFSRFAYSKDKYFNWNEKLSKDFPDKEVDSFAQRKVAAIAGYPSLYDQLVVKIKQLEDRGKSRMKIENIAVTTFPQFRTEEPRYLAKYFALGVSIHSDQPNLAWEFIKFVTSEKQAQYFRQVTGRTPGRIIPINESDSEIARVQNLQLAHSSAFYIEESIKELIEDIVQRALKDKNVIREILDIDLN